MDFGDPRESLVDLTVPGTWEADNRVEERWQWGAQLLDLCNLSPEEYKNSTAVTVKTIQDCGECSGGGGGDVTEDKGTASLSDEGIFTVYFEEPTASKVYVFVTFVDDFGEDYSFQVPVDKGSDSATFDVREYSEYPPYKITNVKVGLKEDGSDADKTVKDKKYEYSVDYGGGGGDKDGKSFAISILCTKTDTLTASDYEAIINAQGQGYDYIDSYEEVDFAGVDTAQGTFFVNCQMIPADVEIWKEDVREEYYQEHSYDFIFLTRESIYEIKQDFTDDTEFWTMETITLNGKTYEKWMRRDLTSAQCPCYQEGNEKGEDLTLPFIFKINK